MTLSYTAERLFVACVSVTQCDVNDSFAGSLPCQLRYDVSEQYGQHCIQERRGIASMDHLRQVSRNNLDITLAIVHCTKNKATR